MAYEDRCGSCNYYEFKGDGEKGYCSYYRSYYYPNDTCNHYSEANGHNYSTGCYITTMVCDILGFDDDCRELTILRGFRDNIMQKDAKYAQTLYQYDTVGPQIADCLKEQFEKDAEEPDEMIVELFNFYIQPTAWLIELKQYDEAVDRYTELTKSLMDYYGIKDAKEEVKDYDYTQGGHGKVIKLGEWGDQ